MEKKIYETPQLERLGSVEDLTAGTQAPTNCSALEADFGTEDALCEINP